MVEQSSSSSSGPSAPGAGDLPPLPDVDAVLDEEGQIAEDIECRHCGYDLRGLRLNGRCPECGTAVGRSIHGDFLRFCDPPWVHQLAAGAWWMILSIFIGVGAGTAAGVIDALIGGQVVQGMTAIAAGAVGLVGYWKLTVPDPATHSNGVSLRGATRWLAVAGFGGAVIDFYLKAATGGATTTSVIWWTLVVTYVALTLAGVVASVLLFLQLRRLALRIPNDGLAQQTLVVMIGMNACLVLLVLGGLAVAAMMRAGPALANRGLSTVGQSLLAVGCAVGLALIVFGLWWVVLLFQYRKELKAAAETAARTWMRSEG